MTPDEITFNGRPKDALEIKDDARKVAREHEVTPRSPSKPYLLNRVDQLEKILHTIYERLMQEAEGQKIISGAAEWLLDNFYTVNHAIQQVRENLPKEYYKELPKLKTSQLSGHPRIFAVSRELIKAVEETLEIKQMRHFIRAYQEIHPLTMGEIWALPTLLRVSTLEILTRALIDNTSADFSVDEKVLPSPPLPPEKASKEIVGSCIQNLLFLENQDWKTFFEDVSLVDEVLVSDPTGTYPRMDFHTRDHYRGVIEEIAKPLPLSEEDIAQEAVRLAEENQKGAARSAHVGYYLVGPGRDLLEGAVQYRPRWRQRIRRWIFDHAPHVYLGGISLLTALVLALLLSYTLAMGGNLFQILTVGILGILPASMVAVNAVNTLITHTVPPRLLPKMDFSEGVPDKHSTMVVIPALLSDAEGIDFLLKQLELHYLGNPDPHLGYAILSDFSDAQEKHLPQDDLLLLKAQKGISDLNENYGKGKELGPFYLFHRERKWNPKEDCWMGWERKRGKLVEFNALLRSGDTSYTVQLGNLAFLPRVEYVITLDADTVLPKGVAFQLIGSLAHPLNQAVFDPDGERVISGYTILQPRTEVKPTAVNQTLFSRIYAGDAGLDLYTRAVSDVYQDFFAEGNFVGKGIYDVDAFQRSLQGRVPENTLLSHDLFEGIHGRVGLLNDVVMLEDYPPGYLSYIYRKHRWIRGDWQISPWLFSNVPHKGEGKVPTKLSLLDRWKIFDNLRRSLRSPVLLALLAAGWIWFPGSRLVWTLITLLVSALPLVTGTMIEFTRWLQDDSLIVISPSLRIGFLRWLVNIVFLPYESLMMIDAIGTALVRMKFTDQRLLEWATSAHTIRILGRESELALLWKRMGSASVLAILLALSLALIRPMVLLIASPLLLAWVVSPRIAGWISKPLEREHAPLSSVQRQKLRRISRRTWLYFERYVGSEDHWLPPDHFQDDPLGIVAHRTSPTNIGLTFLSTLAAFDLGYISFMDLTLRILDAFESMDRLEKFRGHYLNWYDTQNLDPLAPRYVSTVDSGNLAACLLALKQGLIEVQQQPILRWKRWQGFRDTLGVLKEIVSAVEDKSLTPTVTSLQDHLGEMDRKVLAYRENPLQWLDLLEELSNDSTKTLNDLLISLAESGEETLKSTTLHDLRQWSDRVHFHLRNFKNEVERLCPWLPLFQDPPQLFQESSEVELSPELNLSWEELQDALPFDCSFSAVFDTSYAGKKKVKNLEDQLKAELQARDGGEQTEYVSLVQDAQDWCSRLVKNLESTRLSGRSVKIGLQDLIDQAEEMFQSMDFSFLYDRQRKVFRLGYRVDEEDWDNNHYDLLASEARIASFVAIAKGDVPQEHWLQLGRPFSRLDGARVLLSWNGSMFEYLMPELLMHTYEGMLLEQSNRSAVKHQIQYARKRGVPWGVSESGYYRFDAQLNYQYRGFGLPGLGRKRGLGEDLVIAPYASLLAVSISPREVMENLNALIDQDALGPCGFYEAIDYTKSRLSLGQDRAVVRSFMAHHQGMILSSLVNYLESDCMKRRFHNDPRVHSVELLLQERLPKQVRIEEFSQETGTERTEDEPIHIEPWPAPADDLAPQAHFLFNGRYGVMVTSSGGGYSNFTAGTKGEGEPLALTRWRADTTRDHWGTWIYLQEEDRGGLWSAGRQPTGNSPEKYDVLFHPHQAEFKRRDKDLSLRWAVTVAPEDNVEIRSVTLTNHQRNTRRLRVASYGEVVLAPQNTDLRHPAFNKLFIESEYLPDMQGLLFRRRPRSAQESPLYLMHLLVTESEDDTSTIFEGDRKPFLGRGRTARNPAAFTGGTSLTQTDGATLDPILSLGLEIELEEHSTTRFAFLTLTAPTREEILSLAMRYQAWSKIELSFTRARSEIESGLRDLDLGSEDLKHIQQLFSFLTYPQAALRAGPKTIASNRKRQSDLWPYGISGDYPLLLVRISKEEQMPLLRELLRAHAYWRARRLKIDLIILNEKDAGYAQELNDQINQLITKMESDAWVNRRGGIFLLRSNQIEKETRILLQTVARVVLEGKKGSLANQLRTLPSAPQRLPKFVPTKLQKKGPMPFLSRPEGLLFDNGYGGFSPDGREYILYLEEGEWTPAPWINVIANPELGFLVSEAGSGYTWAKNSGENRLTPWHNDPVSNEPGEALYIRDENTAEIWTPTPLPCREDAPYLIRHGAGYSVFEHHSNGLKQRLRFFSAADDPVKIVQLRLENTWETNRRLTTTYYAEWVLGTHRSETSPFIIPDYDERTSALLARNPYHPEYGERVAFLCGSQHPHGLTADRTEFLGREGTLEHPQALGRIGLSGTVKAGLDPCAAVQIHIELDPGESKEVFFLIGQGKERENALQLVEEYRDPERIGQAWKAVTGRWDDILQTVQVETPEPAMNLLLNRWLLYQSLSCRLWARSALYQSSGAFGFRDQLQDVLPLLHARPDLAREHILYAAEHQFREGDVLHWWHPPSGRGVRTRISDDLLWLPYVTTAYVNTTGDKSILEQKIPFRKGEPLGEGEEERYGHYDISDKEAPLYEHCCRALDQGTTSGPHGLPLIGAGDWNDGLNRVGIEGEGESIWLGWFLYTNLRGFADICQRMEDEERANAYRKKAQEIQQALAESAWDGSWYLRAFYDDGTPLGSSENKECQIASMAQSWAALSGAGEGERLETALDSVMNLLVQGDEQRILLFKPPFDETKRDPGYIKGYPPGIRENGGQYTHAALWAAWAFAKQGWGERAEKSFRILNPIFHSDTREKADRYCVEPYAVAADIYSHPQHPGKGGWTWYTGSAGWMYQLGLEGILGFQRRGSTLIIEPCIPQDWKHFKVRYSFRNALYQIRVENPEGVNRGVKRVLLDGQDRPHKDIPLKADGGEYDVRIVMGQEGE